MSNWHQLILQCKRGDPKAQRELYDQFKARLMGVCRRYASSREEAQDILQEVFIKIFFKMEQLEDPESLPGWMMRITVNTAVNFYRQQKRYEFFDLDIVPEAAEPVTLSIEGISDNYLIMALNELPDGCRVVFNLNAVEGYSHAEIASILGISESTSRSQLNYARNLLKEKLSAVGITKFERYA